LPEERALAGAHGAAVRAEFERVAPTFGARTEGRFDPLDVVGFSGIEPGATVAEVGAGTGNFLALFDAMSVRSIAVDLTPAMLAQARERHPGLHLVVADGARLPLASGSVDLATSAQVFHHVFEPLPLLLEMRRIARVGGRVLLVDQVATERFEEAVTMTDLETLRDPSHAVSRPPSALRAMFRSAGLEIVAEKIVSVQERLSAWVPPEEFPEERIAAVRRFIQARGDRTGMGFERAGDDYIFTRRRMMVLGERASIGRR